MKFHAVVRVTTFLSFFTSLFFLSFSNGAFATTFTAEKEGKFPRRINDLKEILLDVDNTCETGCKYKISNLREMRKVETDTETHYYTWIYIDSVRDSSQFFEVTVKESNKSNNSSEEKRELEITSVTPSREKIRELQTKYDLGQKSLIDKVETKWELKEVYDDNHNFLHTTVSYKSKAASDSAILRLFSRTVRSEMNKTANEMFRNLEL